MKGLARNLRRNQTDVERNMWLLLRDRRFKGYKFRRQHQIGRYIVDFYCSARKLIIELDGGQHNQCGYDNQRGGELIQRGFTILRFWNHEVLENSQGVLMKIEAALGPHPNPLPKGEGKR